MVRNAVLLRCALVGTALMFSVDSLAQTDCPWMNAATAGGFLGKPVNATVVRPSKTSDDATCDFIPQRSGAKTALHIAVTTMSTPGQDFAAYLHQCGANPTPLKAIGNEAIECTRTSGSGQFVQVVGRVRDRVFLVKISGDTGVTQLEQLDKAKDVAEQVSESLF